MKILRQIQLSPVAALQKHHFQGRKEILRRHMAVEVVKHLVVQAVLLQHKNIADEVNENGEGEGKKEEYHQHFCGKQGSRSPEFPDSSRNSFKHDC